MLLFTSAARVECRTTVGDFVSSWLRLTPAIGAVIPDGVSWMVPGSVDVAVKALGLNPGDIPLVKSVPNRPAVGS